MTHRNPLNAPYVPCASPTVSRRYLLQALAGTASVWAAPMVFGQTGNAAASTPKIDGRLVVVFLRGAYDGLSALVPHGDPDYYRMRPNISIGAPDGTAQTALALDGMFGLHPAMEAVLPLWKEGVLGAIPAAGSPDATRSHFDAQHHWEIGMPGKSGSAAGWMNTLAGLHSRPAGPAADSTSSAGNKGRIRGAALAVGVGEANPLILSGAQAVQLVAKGDAATKQGVLGDQRTRQAVMSLYAGDSELARTFQAGADSRMQTAKTLTERSAMADSSEMGSAQMLAANNGAGSAKGLLLDAQHLGTLMQKNPQLRLGFLSAGGWDTHANQGNVTGALANNLNSLAATLVQLRRDFSQPNDVVMVVSEFGRTSAENGTRGTDHGHGNTLWLMGNKVQGGRWHGTWTGLAPAHLHDRRDLPVHHDFRGVFAQVLRATQGLGNKDIDTLFPGFAWDTALDGLMRT